MLKKNEKKNKNCILKCLYGHGKTEIAVIVYTVHNMCFPLFRKQKCLISDGIVQQIFELLLCKRGGHSKLFCFHKSLRAS